jgi:hypothetical protein
VVKVEVWDVVDKAKPLHGSEGDSEEDDGSAPSLKLSHTPAMAAAIESSGGQTGTLPEGHQAVNRLDAQTINTLQGTIATSVCPSCVTMFPFAGTHAVVMMVDPSKKWTFEYAQREMPKLPSHVTVLLLVRKCRTTLSVG